MMKESKLVQLPPFNPLSAEGFFLGLTREFNMTNYVGRASFLSDEELQSLFGVAIAAIHESARVPFQSSMMADQPTAQLDGEESLKKQIQSLEWELGERDRKIAHLLEKLGKMNSPQKKI